MIKSGKDLHLSAKWIDKAKILVIIPAYNEEKNIEHVISSIKREFPICDILVVNDGSRDRTGQVAKDMGVVVINLPYNLGIGGAMQTGYRYAADNNYGIAVQVDGDGQHPAEQIKRLVAVIGDGEADVVVGSRFIVDGSYRPTTTRLIGITYFSKLLSLVLGQKVTDTTSGFRAVNNKVISFFSGNYPEDYPEVEALLLLHRKGFRIKEISVDMKERVSGKSSITPFRSLYYMVKVSLAIFIGILRKGPA